MSFLCNSGYVHSRTFFTPKIHPPPITSYHLACLPSLPCSQPPYQASHPTLPATPPCLPPNPACLSCLPSQTALPASSATTALQALRRASAVLVLLQQLCVCGASQRATPSNILHTPSNILCTPSKILHTPSKILCTPSNMPPPILYVNLTCGAADTPSAWPLPPSLVNCGLEPPCEDLEGYIEYLGGAMWKTQEFRRLTVCARESASI